MKFTGGVLAAVLTLTAAPGYRAADPDPPVPFSRIDAHVHVGPPAEAFLDMLERLDVRVLNVTIVDPLVPGFNTTEPQTGLAADISRRSRGRIAWASTFDPAGGEEPGFAERTRRHLRSTFDRGAVAVKMYKSVGLLLQNLAGRYVLPDDDVFTPAYRLIAEHDRTLLTHLAEPRSSWYPLDPADPHAAYYRANPDWYMFNHPDRPSWESILSARDRLLQANPQLRVIGCHLGSMEHDVDMVARRLDRYPNFAVDTAARMSNLMLQPRDKVRAFMIRYQDRILWGTDLLELQWNRPGEVLRRWENSYAGDWKYLSTDAEFTVGGRTVRGLDLPLSVRKKIFRENALRWIPGLRGIASFETGSQPAGNAAATASEGSGAMEERKKP